MSDFNKKILNWYFANKRALPWRDTKDPFKIWLSEIILQQTRVDQGMPYYNKFISSFKTINDLAKADEEKVLLLWQGLGYYSRGRNLHFTAKDICDNMNGVFPSSYNEILKLKGVGKYTAAAIASFCFNEKVAVLDGNVMRVLTRYFGIEDDISQAKTVNSLRELANTLLPNKNHSEYNQGVMEFGALQCSPKSPNCDSCPLSKKCVAFNHHLVKNLPFKSKKIKVRTRFFNFIVLKHGNNLYIKKRIDKDIWQNLYDFPLIEKNSFIDFDDVELAQKIDHLTSNKEFIISVSEDYKHILSHQKIFARFFLIEFKQEIIIKNDALIKVNNKSINELGKPILIQNYLNSYIF